VALTLMWSETTYDQAHADNAWAWSQWAAASCIERHGDHLWYLDLYHPEEDSTVGLSCDYCHISGYDVWNDTAEFIGTEREDGSTGILDGVLLDLDAPIRHDGTRAGRVPVRVTLWQTTYHGYDYTEYDAGLTLAQLGPVEWEDDPDTEGTP
jgi:hypothetical protein